MPREKFVAMVNANGEYVDVSILEDGHVLTMWIQRMSKGKYILNIKVFDPYDVNVDIQMPEGEVDD